MKLKDRFIFAIKNLPYILIAVSIFPVGSFLLFGQSLKFSLSVGAVSIVFSFLHIMIDPECILQDQMKKVQ